MTRLLKLALAIGIPAVVLWVPMQYDPRRGPSSAAELALWFFGYLLVVAAPQLIFLAVCARRSSRNSAVIGGLVALDACLIFVAWSMLHSNDIAGLGWFFYLAASPLFAIAGMVLGKALARLTNR